MFSSANQPVCGRPDTLDELASAVEESEPGRAEQVLENARAEEVDAELLDVNRQRADRLEGVEEHERSPLVCEVDDLAHVDHRPVAVADVSDRDEQRVVVDRALEVLERDRAVVRSRNVLDTRTARLLRVPDLADGRELPVGEDDLRAPRETESACERAHSRGQGRRDGDLVRDRVDEAGEGSARGLLALDPVLPGGALLVPVVEVLLVGASDRVGERALRAGVDVDALA